MGLYELCSFRFLILQYSSYTATTAGFIHCLCPPYQLHSTNNSLQLVFHHTQGRSHCAFENHWTYNVLGGAAFPPSKKTTETDIEEMRALCMLMWFDILN